MSRPVTPSAGVSAPTQGTLSRSNSQKHGYSSSRPVSYIGGNEAGTETADYSTAPRAPSAMSGGVHTDRPGSDGASGLQRSASQMSQSATAVPSRGGTLKKKSSIKRVGSLGRSNSKRSTYAGSVKSMRLGEKEKYEPDPEHNSAFYCPVPTTGSPTELLADRFQAWRKVLKDIINYFRDLQKSYETRAKTLHSASNEINNMSMPSNFMSSGGLAEATQLLREFHKLSLNEANKSRELENEVIQQLTGLRSDLQQKIKEIKSLSGDFKNSVGKEQDQTRKAVRALQDSLGGVDQDAAATAGKGDPFLVKMGVDRQLERQIEEENYLHRAYLNLEASGRELESIVVGEIQKAYTVLAGIMKREADHAYDTAEKLREGPIAMPKDHEWDNFTTNNKSMVDPRVPLRSVGQITYAGKDHPAALEVKSGMLERKSKYLKNYTPGWYVLSPTHLHEFKSADHINFQSPIMSLYLPEQKLGTHSEPGSNSHKFMLKGRQTGSMHRGHSWIFRAETHDTMLAWYNDIKELTEKRGEERNEFVRRTHARTFSSGSMKAPSINSAGSGMEDDEADRAPFSGEQSVRGMSINEGAATGGMIGPARDTAMMDDNRSEPGWRPQRPTPGGRFPSEINVERGLQAPLSPSSGDSFDETDRDAIAAAGALPGSDLPFVAGNTRQPHNDLQQPNQQHSGLHQQSGNELAGAAGSAAPVDNAAGISDYTAGEHRRVAPTSEGAVPIETASTYGEWMAPIAAGVGGAGLGAAGTAAYSHHRHNQDEQQNAIPGAGESSAPIMMDTAPPENAPTEPRAMRDPEEAIKMAAQNAPANSPSEYRPTPQSIDSSGYIAPTSTGQYRPTAETIDSSGYIAPASTNHYRPTPETIDSSGYVAPVSAYNAPSGPMSIYADTPSTTLVAAGFDPASSRSAMSGPPASGLANTSNAQTVPIDTTGMTNDSGIDAAGHKRPEMPSSAKSVMTISDLHVPGEFPRAG